MTYQLFEREKKSMVRRTLVYNTQGSVCSAFVMMSRNALLQFSFCRFVFANILLLLRWLLSLPSHDVM